MEAQYGEFVSMGLSSYTDVADASGSVLEKTTHRKRSINIYHAIAEGEHECLQSRVHPEFGQDTCHVVARCL